MSVGVYVTSSIDVRGSQIRASYERCEPKHFMFILPDISVCVCVCVCGGGRGQHQWWSECDSSTQLVILEQFIQMHRKRYQQY